MKLLADLDKVPWATLRHAYGPATDVPELIRGRASSVQSERHHAFGVLAGNIVHQGTVYEASAHAVPFLIELLGAPELPDLEHVAVLFAAVADGRGNSQAHVRDANSAREWSAILAERGTSLEAELERESAVVRSIRAEAAKGLSLLIPYLARGGTETRLTIASAFGAYPELASELLPAIERALQVEADAGILDRLRASAASLRSSA